MMKNDEYLKEYLSDTETKIPGEKKKGIININETSFLKEYVPDTETKIPDEKTKEIVNKEEKKLEDDMKKYGISKPQRFLIKGRISHD